MNLEVLDGEIGVFSQDHTKRKVRIERYRVKDKPAIVADKLASGEWSLLIDMTAIVTEAPEFDEDENPIYGPGGSWEMDSNQEHYILKEDIDDEVTDLLNEHGEVIANYPARKVCHIDTRDRVEEVVDKLQPRIYNETNWIKREKLGEKAADRGRDTSGDSW